MINEKPIRIAHIMGKLWAGGVEAVVFNYYRHVDKNKVQFDFYYDDDSTVEPPDDLIDMGARFIKIPAYQNLNSYIKTLGRYFNKYQYTIVHSHINTLSVFPLFVAWKSKIPIRIAHNHSVPGGNEYKRNLLKYFLRIFAKLFATDYFACSEKAGRWLFGKRTFDRGKVVVLKNAIDFKRFIFTEQEKDKLRKRLGFSDEIIVGHVGRFTYAKNHSLLLNAFKEMYQKNPRCRLLLVGDGELHDQIISTVKKLQIENAVVMVGKVFNVENYYAIMDVLILPSFFEGLSLTTVEAQAAGVPVVISNLVPTEAIISDSYRYLSVDESPEIWSEEAIKMIGKRVILTEMSEKYDITKAAPWLSRWYINRIVQLNEENRELDYAESICDNGCL